MPALYSEFMEIDVFTVPDQTLRGYLNQCSQSQLVEIALQAIQMCRQLKKQNEELVAFDQLLLNQMNDLQSKNEKQAEQIRKDRQQMFGSHSQKGILQVPSPAAVENNTSSCAVNHSQPDQDKDQSEDGVFVPGHYRRKPRKTKEEMYAGLEKEEVIHPLAQSTCPYCGDQLSKLPPEIRYTLMLNAPKLWLRIDIFEKGSCPNHCSDQDGHETIYSSADQAEPRLLNQSDCSPELLSHIIWMRTFMYTPITRLQNEFAQMNLALSKQTMDNWMISAAEIYAKPLVEEMRKDLSECEILHMDETTVINLEVRKQPKGNKKCSIVVAVSGCYEKEQMVVYKFASTKKQTFVNDLIGDTFHGALMTDGLKGYENYQIPAGLCGNHGKKEERDRKREAFIRSQITDPNLCVKLGCMFHARKYLTDHLKTREDFKQFEKLKNQLRTAATKEEWKSVIESIRLYLISNRPLSYLLKVIKDYSDLYAVEDLCDKAGLAPPERLVIRRMVSGRIFGILCKDYLVLLIHFSEQSNVGQATRYFLDRQSIFARFLLDGRYPLDNNRAERMVKPLVIARKNSLFMGSIKGADAVLMWHSLAESARLNNLDFNAYLNYVFDQMMHKANTQELIRSLLPYSKTLPEKLYLKTKREDF